MGGIRVSDTKKLEREDAKVTGVDGTGVLGSPFTATISAIDRIEDLEHNMTVANTKMDAIIEGTDASLKQLTQMYADAMEQQGEFNKEMNRRNQNTNKRVSQLKKLEDENHAYCDTVLKRHDGLMTAMTEHMGSLNMKYDTMLGEFNVRLDNVYMALGVMFGIIVLLLVVVGYLMFAGA